jgi:hypothetical protein
MSKAMTRIVALDIMNRMTACGVSALKTIETTKVKTNKARATRATNLVYLRTALTINFW